MLLRYGRMNGTVRRTGAEMPELAAIAGGAVVRELAVTAKRAMLPRYERIDDTVRVGAQMPGLSANAEGAAVGELADWNCNRSVTLVSTTRAGERELALIATGAMPVRHGRMDGTVRRRAGGEP
jgi:hypothetical protein